MPMRGMRAGGLKIFITLIAVNLLFGAGYPLVKALFPYIRPDAWLLVRSTISGTVLLAIYWRQISFSSINLNTLFWLILGAASGILINQILFVEGVHRTLPAHAALINATVPLQAMLLSWFFLNEKPTLMRLLGMAIGFVGIASLLKIDHWDHFNPLLMGDLLSLGNAFAYSLYLVIARGKLSAIPPGVALTLMTLLALPGFAWNAQWHFPIKELASLSPQLWLYVFYLCLITGALCYIVYLWALKRVEASQAAIYVYVQPLSATVLAFLMFGNQPDSRFYVSAGMILVGILLSSLRK